MPVTAHNDILKPISQDLAISEDIKPHKSMNAKSIKTANSDHIYNRK